MTMTPKERKAAFVKTFLHLSQRFNTWEIWSDFIVMTAAAISNAVDHTHREQREALYEKAIEKYNEKERSVFPELIALMAAALTDDPEQDFLGSVYMELNLGNHWIGQFFTPYDVCRCMADITTGSEVVDQIERDGYVSLNDCACGAGATLIAGVHAIRHALQKANSPLIWYDHVLVVAQDIDFTTGMMCYIQLSLIGCAGYIKIGNTLTDPMHTGDDLSKYWFTPMYFSKTWHLRRIFRNLDSLFNREADYETDNIQP